MGNKMKSFSVAACLFVFLFVVLGASLHLKPMGAFLAALSGTSLVIRGVNRWGETGLGTAGKPGTRSTCLDARLVAPDRQERPEDSERVASRVASKAVPTQ
jgi:hypothetical protein